MAKITTIKSLDDEIRRLQAKAKDLEGRLDESLDYLQDNYSSMIMKSVLGNATGGIKSGIAGTVLSVILSNDKLSNAFSKIMNDLMDKTATGLDWLAEKMTRKKDEADD